MSATTATTRKSQRLQWTPLSQTFPYYILEIVNDEKDMEDDYSKNAHNGVINPTSVLSIFVEFNNESQLESIVFEVELTKSGYARHFIRFTPNDLETILKTFEGLD